MQKCAKVQFLALGIPKIIKWGDGPHPVDDVFQEPGVDRVRLNIKVSSDNDKTLFKYKVLVIK